MDDAQQGRQKSTSHPTIFHEILDSRLPPHEKTLGRLAQDGGAVVGAGTVTTAWAITVATYYLVAQPQTLRALKQELDSAIPDTHQPLDLLVLEQLPYLCACVQECLRLSYGVSSRLQRISPDEPLVFPDPTTKKSWHIPPGTPVSMTALLIFQNPTIFPDPLSFRPERWLENPRLDRYQVAFSKGTRICLGMNLALAEIYLMVAAVFRRYGTEEARGKDDVGMLGLFETSDEDVHCAIDGFVPLPKPGSQGVRVKVVSC